jgi:DNA ligase (NAD+)
MLSLNEINALTQNLVAQSGNNTVQIDQIEDLRNVIRFHEHRYYILNEPLLGDTEYDLLFNTLKKLEAANPILITPDSPTQRVGVDLNKNFANVHHLVPMLSLENSYDADDLLDWDRKNKETLKLNRIQYCIEPKFDGASISLIYENDYLVRGATRGDGVMGDDITNNIKQIKSIPLSAAFAKHNIQQIEIRGEVLLNKKNFYDFNKQLEAQNLPPLANPRNAAAGSLRMKDPKEVKKRNLEAFLYHVSFFNPVTNAPVEDLSSHSNSLNLLWNLGFKSPKNEMKVCHTIEEVIDYCFAYESKRDDLPYEIDGMVIKVDPLEHQDALGMTTHHPRWAMAYKFKARQATSILKNVEFQVGRTGSITPVAKIDPVGIGGVTVGSISLFNEDVIREKDLMIGDTVLVERAGDVIPYIVKPLPELRNENCQPIIFPTNCPVCNSPLVKPLDEAVWRCVNYHCSAQIVERMIHFTSKDAMDIRGLGDSIIRKFYELKFLTDIPGIYTLPFEQIGQLEGFGAKSVQNLKTAIEQSKTQSLNRLIFALGIRYVGETTAKTLANAVSNLYDLKDWTVERLQSLEDVGPKVANSVFEFFQNPINLQLIDQLQHVGVDIQQKSTVQVDGNLTGVTFLFTGTLSKLKRSDAEALVEQHGGKLLSGVSSKLNFLVAGEDAGSKLEKAKKLSTVKIISEDEFLSMINR